MESLTSEQLKIAGERNTRGRLELHWTGKSQSRDPGSILRPYFDKVLDSAASDGIAVEMHFERLEYLNSSTIAALIQLIHAAQQKAVPLVLYYDGKQKWQTLSFDGLRRAIQPFTTGGKAPVEFVVC